MDLQVVDHQSLGGHTGFVVEPANDFQLEVLIGFKVVVHQGDYLDRSGCLACGYNHRFVYVDIVVVDRHVTADAQSDFQIGGRGGRIDRRRRPLAGRRARSGWYGRPDGDRHCVDRAHPVAGLVAEQRHVDHLVDLGGNAAEAVGGLPAG